MTSKFQARHYEAIATVLRPYSDKLPINMVALDLAEMFENDNPNFNRERFEKACGLRD